MVELLLRVYMYTVVGRSVVASAMSSSRVGLDVSVPDVSSGAFEVRVDGEVWLAGGHGDGIEISADGMKEGDCNAVVPLTQWNKSTGADSFGNFTAVEMEWGDASAASPTLTTTIRLYQARELIVFTQAWPRGWRRAPAPPPPPAPNSVPVDLPVPSPFKYRLRACARARVTYTVPGAGSCHRCVSGLQHQPACRAAAFLAGVGRLPDRVSWQRQLGQLGGDCAALRWRYRWCSTSSSQFCSPDCRRQPTGALFRRRSRLQGQRFA